jgi:drug/metabolite transporter (DMT)-like permease
VAIGLFGLLSGVLSLLCHVLLEPSVALNGRDWLLMVLMGLGPLGSAFFLWDAALKKGDARKIGILSYITPLASTVLLLLATGRPLTWSIGLATVLILGAAVLGSRAQ